MGLFELMSILVTAVGGSSDAIEIKRPDLSQGNRTAQGETLDMKLAKNKSAPFLLPLVAPKSNDGQDDFDLMPLEPIDPNKTPASFSEYKKKLEGFKNNLIGSELEKWLAQKQMGGFLAHKLYVNEMLDVYLTREGDALLRSAEEVLPNGLKDGFREEYRATIKEIKKEVSKRVAAFFDEEIFDNYQKKLYSKIDEMLPESITKKNSEGRLMERLEMAIKNEFKPALKMDGIEFNEKQKNLFAERNKEAFTAIEIYFKTLEESKKYKGSVDKLGLGLASGLVSIDNYSPEEIAKRQEYIKGRLTESMKEKARNLIKDNKSDVNAIYTGLDGYAEGRIEELRKDGFPRTIQDLKEMQKGIASGYEILSNNSLANYEMGMTLFLDTLLTPETSEKDALGKFDVFKKEQGSDLGEQLNKPERYDKKPFEKYQEINQRGLQRVHEHFGTPIPGSEGEENWYEQGWFWGTVGGVAAAGLVLGLGLGLGLQDDKGSSLKEYSTPRDPLSKMLMRR